MTNGNKHGCLWNIDAPKFLEMIDFEREGKLNEKASSQVMNMWNTKTLPPIVQK